MSALIGMVKSGLFVAAFITVLLNFPPTPFTDLAEHIPDGFKEMMAYVAYYVPFKELASIGIVWLHAMFAYYGANMTLKIIRSQI